MINPIARFKNGFTFVIEGWRLVRKVPGLKKWLIIPFVIDFAIIIAGVSFGTTQIQTLVKKAMLLFFTRPDSMAFNFFYFPVLFIFWLIFIVLYLYLVYLIASVLASPIYSVMSERTNRHLAATAHLRSENVAALPLALRMLWISLNRGLVLLIIGGFLFVSSFVPGLNLFTAFTAFVLLAFDSADYAFEVHHFQLRDRFRFLRENLVEFCGMGAFMGLTAIIPGLILFTMPFAVVGATSVVFTILHRNKMLETLGQASKV